mgnify:CR=1 FL=1
MLLLMSFFFSGFVTAQEEQSKQEENIKVIAAPNYYSITSHWAGQFNNENRGLTIEVKEDASINQTILDDNLSKGAFAVTSMEGRKKISENYWSVTIGRRVIVPIINKNNPEYEKIMKTGLSKDDLKAMVSNTEGEMHLMRCASPEVASNVQRYLGVENPQFYQSFDTPEELVEAVKNDPLAIAFCPLKNVVADTDNKLTENLALIPLDRNANNKIDPMEDICRDLNTFMRSVWIGKFPHALCCNIKLVASEMPESDNAKQFVSYILSNGQNDLNNFGFSILAYSERQNQLQKIQEPEISVAPSSDEDIAWIKLILIIAGILIAVSVLVGLILKSPSPKSGLKKASGDSNQAFNDTKTKAPAGLYFDKTHTWTFLEKNGAVRTGLDDFIQHATGRISRVIMREAGENIKKGDKLITLVQDGKQLTLYAPVSGIIKEVNKKLHTELEKINADPYGEGWLYLIEPANWRSESQFMKLAESYQEWLKNEFNRLKDFIAHSANLDKTVYNSVVLQDGGALKDHVLEELGPEAWEEFQTKFIDTPNK